MVGVWISTKFNVDPIPIKYRVWPILLPVPLLFNLQKQLMYFHVEESNIFINWSKTPNCGSGFSLLFSMVTSVSAEYVPV